MKLVVVFRKLILRLIKSEDYLGDLELWCFWEDGELGTDRICGYLREEKSKFRSLGFRRKDLILGKRIICYVL